jgi:hypothetical protein
MTLIRVDFTGKQLEGDVVEGQDAGEPFGQPAHLEDRDLLLHRSDPS